MEHLHSDLGVVEAGALVVVRLQGTEANVLLLDDGNYASYQTGRTFQYHGGHYRSSPVRISVPSTRRWHVAIDLGGGTGSIQASVNVITAGG